MTIPECVIDLSGNGDDSNSSSPEEINGFDTKFIVRPTSTALKSIGIGMIKMQFFDNTSRVFAPDLIKDSDLKKKDDLWQTAWLDDPKAPCNYQFRHMLEFRFERNYKCVLYRSPICQNQIKMTRLNWLHQRRLGHSRIRDQWRRILNKKNNCNIASVFEIFCLVCPQKKRSKCVPYNPSNYILHMKKNHPTFLAYDEYLSYFDRCFICNDQTKSMQQNLSHRQLCLAALIKDPNQVGTEHFNNCFKTQSCMSTLSLESGINRQSIYDMKMKLFNNSKCSSIYLWLQLKKNGMPNPLPISRNGYIQKPVVLNASLFAFKQNFMSNKAFMNCISDMSDRIVPGSHLDTTKLHKFFVPVPFSIKNEVQSKSTYFKWRKSIKDAHSKIQSNAPWYCEICNAMLRNGRTAYCHIRMCHPMATFYESTCKSCSKKFLTNQGFKNHYQAMNRCPVTRRCIVCNQSVSINDIYEHMSLKHKDDLASHYEQQMCLICRGKVDNLCTHLFDIHGMSNVIQGQIGVGKFNYRNGTFFNCAKCSLTYYSEVELRNHMIMNNHYFECSKCPSLKFYLSWELMHHLSVCLKPDDNCDNITCDLCPGEKVASEALTFAMSSELVEHFIKVHLSPCRVLLTDIYNK